VELVELLQQQQQEPQARWVEEEDFQKDLEQLKKQVLVVVGEGLTAMVMEVGVGEVPVEHRPDLQEMEDALEALQEMEHLGLEEERQRKGAMGGQAKTEAQEQHLEPHRQQCRRQQVQRRRPPGGMTCHRQEEAAQHRTVMDRLGAQAKVEVDGIDSDPRQEDPFLIALTLEQPEELLQEIPRRRLGLQVAKTDGAETQLTEREAVHLVRGEAQVAWVAPGLAPVIS